MTTLEMSGDNGARPQPRGSPAEDIAEVNYVDRSLQSLARATFSACIVAWILTYASRNMWFNLPAAFAAVAAFHWFYQQVRFRGAAGQSVRARRARVRIAGAESSLGGGAFRSPSHESGAVSPGTSVRADQRWREAVGSPVVEAAWETLCGSMVQEFIYDAWYAYLTPDREFPREVRGMLNRAFGELAHAARALDLRQLLLGEIAEAVVEHLQLYRDTKSSILQGMGEQAWQTMAPSARERALQAELRSDSNLHPALYPASAASTSNPYMGHYKVLRRIAEGLAECLMTKAEHSRPLLRSLCRELLAACVLRSIIACFSPYQANKLLLRLMQERAEKRAAPEETEGVARPLHRNPLQTHWEFEERLRRSAVLEDVAAASHRAVRLAARERSSGLPSHPDRANTEAGPATQESKPAAKLPPASSSAAVNERDRRKSLQKAQPPALQAGALLRTTSAASLGNERNHSDSDGWEDVGGASAPRSAPASTAASPLPAPNASREARPENPWPDPGEAASSDSHPRTAHSRQSDSLSTGRADSKALQSSGSVPSMADFRGDSAECMLPRPYPQRGQGFRGRPKAQVVVAELAQDSGKEVVMYKIRMADARGEWTVSRRFRHFEALHRVLRDVPGYGLKPPGKRIFSRTQNVEFVEERRQLLDSYLGQILADASLAGRQEVWEFCSASNEAYGTGEAGFLQVVGANLRDAHSSVRRKVGDVVDDLDSRRRRFVSARSSESASKQAGPPARGQVSQPDGSAHMRRGQAGEADAELEKERRRLARLSHPAELLNGAGALLAAGARKVSSARSFLQGLQDGDDAKEVPLQPLAAAAAQLPPLGRPSAQGTALPEVLPMPMRLPNAALDTAPMRGAGAASREEDSYNEADFSHYRGPTFSQRPTPFQSQTTTPNITPATTTPASSRAPTPPGSGHVTPAATPTAAAMHTGMLGGGGDLPRRGDMSSLRSSRFRQESRSARLGGTIAESPAEGDAVEAELHVPDHPATMDLSTAIANISSSAATPQPSIPSAPAAQSIQPIQTSVAGVEMQVSAEGHIMVALSSEVEEQPGAHLVVEPASTADVGMQTGPSLDSRLRSSTSANSFYGEEGRSEGSDGWEEETTGISAPFYEFVDTLFELHRRGFFRRQILGLARQLLSLVAGGAIDDWLAQQLRTLRQEHTLSRLILSLQASLWPGGTWFLNLQEPPPGGPHPRVPMTEEQYLVTDGPAPLDDQEIREAVWSLLSSRAPPSLVRVIGKQAYLGGMADLYNMMQSTTFMHQLGYIVLRILLVSLFPRLGHVFQEIELGPAALSSAPAGTRGREGHSHGRPDSGHEDLRRVPSAPNLRLRASKSRA